MLGGIFKFFQGAEDITVGNNLSATTVPVNRVLFSLGGRISSDSDLTFIDDTLYATNVESSNIESNNCTIGVGGFTTVNSSNITSTAMTWGATGRFGGATHNSEFEADGTLKFNGNATIWDDLRILPSNFDRPGVTDPTSQNWQPGGSGTTYKVWCFDQNQAGYFTCQFPHGYKIGSAIFAHVHWTPHARGAAENTKTVQWLLDYSIADIDGNFPASQTLNLTDTCDGTDHKHQMSPEVALNETYSHVSGMLIGKIYRGGTDTWVGTGANGPAILELDFHFELDTVGSRTRTAK